MCGVSGREQLSSRVEQLRSRLAESQQSLQSSTAELQQLQTEHDTLMERHNKILQDAVSKEAELRERWAGFSLVYNTTKLICSICSLTLPICLLKKCSPSFNFLSLCIPPPPPDCCQCSRRTWLWGRMCPRLSRTCLPRWRPSATPTGSSSGSCRMTTGPPWRPCRASWPVSRSNSSTCRARTVRLTKTWSV